MGLQALRQAQAIRMGVFWIGRMRAQRDLGAERGIVWVKGRGWRRACQKGLQDKRIQGEGREPLPQHFLKSCPRLAHGANRASKSRGGQAADLSQITLALNKSPRACVRLSIDASFPGFLTLGSARSFYRPGSGRAWGLGALCVLCRLWCVSLASDLRSEGWMGAASLAGKRILIIENDDFVAHDLVSAISEIGGIVMGPVASLSAACDLMAADQIDAAVLDINLRADMVFPAAAQLRERGIPFVFARGQEQASVPDAFGPVLRAEKPLDTDQVLSVLAQRAGDQLTRGAGDGAPPRSFLSWLPTSEANDILSFCESVECDARDVLIVEDQPIRKIYFPETAVLTVLATGTNMRPIDAAMIGPEGMTDMAHYDGDRAPLRTFVLIGGRMKQIAAETFFSLAQRSPRLQSLIANYRETIAVQFAFAALAHGTMTIEGRLARFILMVQDRLQGEDILIVHNLIADVLAVRRSGITTALHVLEGMGAIKSVRGRIIIRNRTLLRELADGSYGVAEREYLRMMSRPGYGEAGLRQPIMGG